jgi:hypothetical protein
VTPARITTPANQPRITRRSAEGQASRQGKERAGKHSFRVFIAPDRPQEIPPATPAGRFRARSLINLSPLGSIPPAPSHEQPSRFNAHNKKQIIDLMRNGEADPEPYP